ncbi:hypothetical protein B0H19DRAFT_1067389 [Mycena capillaripes]|nr:hypothetical protein B0H19DRAFT_1067389 [Mycena capillaripes]
MSILYKSLTIPPDANGTSAALRYMTLPLPIAAGCRNVEGVRHRKLARSPIWCIELDIVVEKFSAMEEVMRGACVMVDGVVLRNFEVECYGIHMDFLVDVDYFQGL